MSNKKYEESNKKLLEMISTDKCQKEWSDNYHVIDHDWIIKWKDLISYDNLEKECKNENDYQNYFQKNIKKFNLDKLNNQTIYYEGNNSIDPMQKFDIISDEAWRLFNIKNNDNSQYNGKISILKGNGKIIIRFNENNYSVKYLTNDPKNLFREFVIEFPPECENKKNILDDLAANNIQKWMNDIQFKYEDKQFTVNKYKEKDTKFDIKQKTNNFPEESLSTINFNLLKQSLNESCKYISFSGTSFSPFSSLSYPESMTSSFIDFFNEIENHKFVQKINQSSHIISIMRCLSFIKPFAEYFLSCLNSYFFSLFQSKGLLNLTREYFTNLWDKEKGMYQPIDFIHHVRDKTKIDMNEEKDPYDFLNYFIDTTNKKLNKKDRNINFNFNHIAEKLKNQSFSDDLKKIMKNNNSIIAQTFFGLILETYKCNTCNENIEKIKELKMIEIEYREIIKFFNEEPGISCVNLDIDDFLEYYFLRKDLNINPESYVCPKCKKDAKIIKKEILEYPPYLIIRLKRGEYIEKKGFVNNIDINDINIKYGKIKHINIFHSPLIKEYNNIKREYELICMVNYMKDTKTEKIRFISICKNFTTKKYWISFICNTRPQKLKKDYENDVSLPYILFYQLK